MPSNAPLRLAIIGAGIFARDAHVPALQTLPDTFDIVAVCSRTMDSASRLASGISPSVEALTDVDALLARDDIDAVDVIMPIETMPDVVEKALRAGKHVISEKPVSPDVVTGRRLLDVPRDSVWMVAENYRYIAAYNRAAEMVRSGEIGQPLLAHWAMHVSVTPANKYYHTAWRRSGDFPGGFLLDGGVHHVATMRMVLGEIASVSAFVAQMREDLPPADTLSATLQFASGALGSYSITFAATDAEVTPLTVAGEQGTLHIRRAELELVRDGERSTISLSEDGIRDQFIGFAEAIRANSLHRNTPDAALQDVAVIEAMLNSAEMGQRIAPERIINV